MDLGATLCRVREPLCLVCPLLGVCGGPTALPRKRPQGEFRASARFFRGRVVDALRAVPAMHIDDLVATTGASPELIERLVRDGLVSLDGERVALRA
jgi:A/G-specific adenine glycosylase